MVTTGNVTIGRGERTGLLTGDSALSSFRDPDESHDGDIDSDQEYRHQPLYYPSQHDSARFVMFLFCVWGSLVALAS